MRYISGSKKILNNILPNWVLHFCHKLKAGWYLRSIECKHDRNNPTIIFLNHFFTQDYLAFRKANTKFNIIEIDPSKLFAFSRFYFDNDVIGLNAVYDKPNDKKRHLYKKECEKIFLYIKNKFGFNLLISPSDNYYWVRELIFVARENRVKTVILDKEGLITPFHYEAEANRLRDFAPFISDQIFVWSERQKQFWKKIGVEEKKITVIGQPRSDLFFDPSPDNGGDLLFNNDRIVTFFTYEDDAYIPREYVVKEGMSWSAMKSETHQIIKELANAFPQIKFVIKCHPQQPDLSAIKSKYESQNLFVIGGSTLGNYLIMHSEIVIGFQTTAIIESMMLRKKTVYTAWDSNIQRIENLILPLHRACGLKVVYNKNDLYSIVNRALCGDISDFITTYDENKKRADFVDEYFYQADGNVCKRLFKHLERIL